MNTVFRRSVALVTGLLVAGLATGCATERSVDSMQDVKVVAEQGEELLAEVRTAIDQAVGPVTWDEMDASHFTETGEKVDGFRLARYTSANWVVQEPLIADPDRWTAALQATEATLQDHGYSTDTQILGTDKHAVVVWHDDTGRSIELGSSKATVLYFESGPQLGDPVDQ
ncbi:LppA family lipoprotein [Oerskovia jenensis]|uniref:LppA family lipoprotein n=1 Tax=Oerskovia jenensis TaxID=162169 RepID=UPI0036DD3CEF